MNLGSGVGSIRIALQQKHPHRIPVNSFNLNQFSPSPDVCVCGAEMVFHLKLIQINSLILLFLLYNNSVML